MQFRPCIDIHNGKVKQIVGSSLRDQNDAATENFVSEKSAADFAKLYASKGLKGGHIILLNHKDSEYFEATKAQALAALRAYPNGMQVGGGITADNAKEYIDAGASHVIVTSYVFVDGEIRFDRLDALKKAVGREHIVLDLSCKKYEDGYYVCTDRWQKKTDEKVDIKLLCKLKEYCSEYLIHAVDVEGKNHGIEADLLTMLSDFTDLPITYAGGIHSFEDLEKLSAIGRGNIHATIGSALDLFGGHMEFDKVCEFCLGLQQ